MKNRLLLLLFLTYFLNYAQNRTCGMEEKMQSILSNPILKQQYEARQEKFRLEYKKIIEKQLLDRNKNANATQQSPNVVIKIPVAVHYPSSGSANAALRTCLRTFAQNQIDILNADYNATNADISNWTNASVFYPGVNVGDLDVEFVIATQNHPSGTGLVNGDMAVTFGTDFLSNADIDATWSGYMNFVVRNISGGILGYSPLGGSPLAGQAVVMDNNAFASGAGCTGFVPGAPYNLGRTVTHELGHFFNLDHIFKSADDSSTDCSGADEDNIADTPKQAGCTYGCAADGSRDACVPGEKVLSMNYMDYSNDACMYMFTQGQKNVALAYLSAISSEFLQNVLSTNESDLLTFSVYPNPTKGMINIQFANLVTDFDISIYDITGRQVDFVKNNTLENKSVTLNNASKGVYFISISYDNKQTTKKIIVE